MTQSIYIVVFNPFFFGSPFLRSEIEGRLASIHHGYGLCTGVSLNYGKEKSKQSKSIK